MRARTFQFWIILVVLLPVGGCLEGVDPVTGEATMSLDPNAADTGESIAEGVIALAPLFGSAGAGIAATLAGALGIWRQKIRPKLEEQRTKADHYHAAAAATVEGVEAIKGTYPEQWAAVKGQFMDAAQKQGIDPLIVENVIRGLRGLPAKPGPASTISSPSPS